MSGPGRNEPCPCGSGKKYKHCHGVSGASTSAVRTSAGRAGTPGPDALAHALALHQRGALDEAETAYIRILAAQPGQYPAVLYLGILRAQRGDWLAAVETFREAAMRLPREAAIHFNLGKALNAAGEPREARSALARALKLRPASAETWNEAALAAQACGDDADAETSLRRAISLQPDYFEAWNNLGLLLLGRDTDAAATDAVGVLEKAVLHSRGEANVLVNLAMALKACGRLSEAEAIYKRVLEIDAGHARALCNFGNLLVETDRVDDADARYAAALVREPESVDALLGRATVALRRNRHEDAERLLRDVLLRLPDSLEAQTSLGIVLQRSNRLEEAEPFLRRVIAQKPDHAPASSALLFLLDHKPGISSAELRDEHARWGTEVAGRFIPARPVFANSPDPERVLKVGYVSADFRYHAVSFFLEPLLAHHDRSTIEAHCYYNDWPEDEVTGRIRGQVAGFTRIAGMPDDRAAELIRRDGIDILIDLSGHTRGNRLLLLARRPAPVQATWLGYPNTSGLSTIDYRISDPFADPPGMTEANYTERLLRLPHVLCCFQPSGVWPDVSPLPASTDGFVTFGSLNSPAKIGPEVVRAWARILRELPSSRLTMLRADEPATRARIENAFQAEGVDISRIAFLPTLEPAPFREQLARMDTVLDAFPLVGGTTTCEALWMGLPVVTLAGDAYLKRVGASWLANIGRPEWIASSTDEYVTKALGLARDPVALASMRAGLRDAMRTSPLCDAPGFARDFEVTLRGVWQEWCSKSRSA